MGNIVVLNGKKFKKVDANDVLEQNTNDEIHDYFYGNGIHAKMTRHIETINRLVANTKVSAGRPRKTEEDQPGQ